MQCLQKNGNGKVAIAAILANMDDKKTNMQGELPYLAIEDMCDVFNLELLEKKKRKIEIWEEDEIWSHKVASTLVINSA